MQHRLIDHPKVSKVLCTISEEFREGLTTELSFKRSVPVRKAQRPVWAGPQVHTPVRDACHHPTKWAPD